MSSKACGSKRGLSVASDPPGAHSRCRTSQHCSASGPPGDWWFNRSGHHFSVIARRLIDPFDEVLLTVLVDRCQQCVSFTKRPQALPQDAVARPRCVAREFDRGSVVNRREEYGGSHSTLIGLLAAWWIVLSPTEHSVLDGAPSHGSGNAGWCDLMLCATDVAVGVVEVEGTKPLEKLRTLDGTSLRVARSLAAFSLVCSWSTPTM